MKLSEAKIEEFTSIQDAYSFVEENVIQLEQNWEITGFWVKVRESIQSAEDKQKAQWEVESFLFEFNANILFTYSSSNGASPGEVNSFPSLKESFDYLKKRAATCENPVLKARYNHLLWKSPKGVKNKDYAIIAIDSYLLSIKKYAEISLANPDNEIALRLGRTFETLASLCENVKHGISETNALAKYLVFDVKLKFYTKHGILNDMLDHPKIFKKDSFQGALDLFETEIADGEADDFILVRFHLPTALRIAQKTKTDVERWHNEIGQGYLRMAEKETQEDRLWIKQDHYVKAIEAFTLAGNSEKIKEGESLYALLKPKVRLNNIEIPFDLETTKVIREFQDDLKRVATNLLKLPPNEIYAAIANGINFPKYADILKSSKNHENAFMHNVFSTIHFDRNKNISKKSAKENEPDELFTTFGHQVMLALLPYLHYVFIEGIKTQKITIENLLKYLIEKTWIGKPHVMHDLGGAEKSIHWMQVITPSLVEYVKQIEGWTGSRYYQPSFTLCLDSLTLKIEGLLRNFCERVNIPTSVSRKKGMQEKYIGDILEGDQIKVYFNDDDLLFLNYVFSDKGLNLRNNIAHCFYDYTDYNNSKMLLLLAALLRIGKYDSAQK